jgi:hypothetical protein
MWCKYTMEYCSAIKENEIKLFPDKWMEMEIMILSEVSQVQKAKVIIFLSYVER